MTRVVLCLAALVALSACSAGSDPPMPVPAPPIGPEPSSSTADTPPGTSSPTPPPGTPPATPPVAPVAPDLSGGPGRQPPLGNASSDIDVQVALDTVTVLTGAAPEDGTTYAARSLAESGWQVRTTAAGLVATRTDVPQVRADQPWHLASASPDFPTSLGVLLTFARAVASRSTHAPTVLVVGDGAQYVGTLAPDLQAVLEDPAVLDVAPGTSTDELRRQAAELLDRL